MKRDTMYAISPLDGRYAQIGEELKLYFSEYALISSQRNIGLAIGYSFYAT